MQNKQHGMKVCYLELGSFLKALQDRHAKLSNFPGTAELPTVVGWIFFRFYLEKISFCETVNCQQSRLFWHLAEKFLAVLLYITCKLFSEIILHGFILLLVHSLTLVIGARSIGSLFSSCLLIFLLLTFDSKWHLWTVFFFFNIFFFFPRGTYSSAANSLKTFLLSFLDCKYYDKVWINRLEPLNHLWKFEL